MAVEPLSEALVDSLRATVFFHTDHLDDLAPPAHECSQVVSLWLRKRSCLWSHTFCKECVSV
jgi:hypothetical protein